MKPGISPFVLSIVAVVASAGAGSAQNVCMSATEMEASLIDWYGEAPVDGSATDSTEIWASDDTGTWTLVQYLADGQSCVLAQGHDWGSEVSEDLLLAELGDDT